MGQAEQARHGTVKAGSVCQWVGVQYRNALSHVCAKPEENSDVISYAEQPQGQRTASDSCLVRSKGMRVTIKFQGMQYHLGGLAVHQDTTYPPEHQPCTTAIDHHHHHHHRDYLPYPLISFTFFHNELLLQIHWKNR